MRALPVRHDVRKPIARRVSTVIALALAHAAIIAYLAVPVRFVRPAADDLFVTHVFFIQEAEERNAEQQAAPSSARTVRRSKEPVQSAPITLPPESTNAAPPASPRIDWAREAELSASRQLQSDEDARRRAAPFSHDFSAQAPVRPTPQFGWDHAHTQRIEPLENGGTLIWFNDRCGLVLAGMLFPVCKIGKIPARDDLFEHMNDPPVLGAEPRPP